MRTVGLTVKEERQDFCCPHCNKECASKSALERHIAKEHMANSEGGEAVERA